MFFKIFQEIFEGTKYSTPNHLPQTFLANLSKPRIFPGNIPTVITETLIV